MERKVLMESALVRLRRIHAVSPSGYLRAVAGAFLLMLIAAAATNVVVDPKGLYQLIRVEGFNLYKPFQPDYTREVKALAARRYAPDTIVFGASTVMFGMDAQCRNSTLPGVGRVYNYAGAAAEAQNLVINLDDLMAI